MPTREENKPLVKEEQEDNGGKTKQDDDEEEEVFHDEAEKEFIEENEEELEQALTEDIYSLLYTAPVCSWTYIFATIIFALQAGLLLLIFLSLVDLSWSDPNETNGTVNRMDLPAGASIEVTIAQLVAMFITIMVMASDGDAIKGIMQLIEGYDPSIRQDSPNATCIRWFFTGILQASVGLLLLLVSFVLTMQSTTVIDLTLNLTGLHFIQELDDMGFTLASKGLISKQTQEACMHVATLNRQPTPKEVKQKTKVTKRLLIAAMGMALLGPYLLVVSWQFRGLYMCKTLYIQFGDVLPEMSYYSGMFTMQGNRMRDRKDGRPFYLDETGTLQLAYCKAEDAWCFSHVEENPCIYFMKSSETENFDVIEVALDGWFVKAKSGVDVAVDWLAVACYDCNENTCQGTCNDNNRCECGADAQERLGLYCEFEIPTCTSYSLDHRTKSNLASIPGAKLFLDTEFTSLEGFDFITKTDPLLTMNNRLLYVPHPDSEQQKGSYYVRSFMLFTGRRWVIFSVPIEKKPPYTYVELYHRIRPVVQNPNYSNIDKLTAITRSKDFEAYVPVFFSTPVNWGTDSDGVEPSHVQWVQASKESNATRVSDYYADDNLPVNVRLLCSYCDEPSQPCYNEGICDDKNTCLCNLFYEGSRCEEARMCLDDEDCWNGGTCDRITNTCNCVTDENTGSPYFGTLCQFP